MNRKRKNGSSKNVYGGDGAQSNADAAVSEAEGDFGQMELRFDTEVDDQDAGSEYDNNTDNAEFGDEYNDEELNFDDEDSAEDPDRQGLIRTIDGAHLVYKRAQEDGTYDELWIYNTQDIKNDLEVQDNILDGTDIPKGEKKSQDGSQSMTLWSVGNVQFCMIKGLPS